MNLDIFCAMSKTKNKQLSSPIYLFLGRKLFGRILLCLTFASLVFTPTESSAKRTEAGFIEGKYAAYVIDADTGQVLHGSNENKKLHPASLTKLMTLLMVFDALERGDLKLFNRVYISKYAASMSPSKLNLPAGSTIKVEDAILALVTKSANDIAVALAEKLGGTEDNFSYMMTRKAHSLGMKHTRFKNASGLHNPEQVSTAHDMGILGRVMVTDYKKYYPYFSTKNFSYNGNTYSNHNKLMKSYEGMDGMKTGYIRASGFNLIASAKRQDHRLVGVVFGGLTGNSRNAQMEKLLNNGFKEVAGVYILANEVPIPKKKPQLSNDNLYTIASIEPIKYTTASTVPPEKPKSVDQPSSRDSSDAEPSISRWNMLDSSRENSMFNRMIGEGDYDVTVRNRIETGLIAISAQLRNVQKENDKSTKIEEALAVVPAIPSSYHSSVISNFTDKGGLILTSANTTEMAMIEPAAAPIPETYSYKAEQKDIPASDLHGNWSIQVGAFASRERTEKALTKTLNMLPNSLGSARSKVAPLKTAQGWIYRARFEGYSKAAAEDACKLLPDCIALAPINN
jgi:D-alanyl-D-alanine carboxypeptidase